METWVEFLLGSRIISVTRHPSLLGNLIMMTLKVVHDMKVYDVTITTEDHKLKVT